MDADDSVPKSRDLDRQWADLFRLESLATTVGGLRIDALCFKCKCSHGCSTLVADPEIFGHQFFAVRASSDSIGRGEAARVTLEQIDRVHQLLREHNGVAELARSSADTVRIGEAGRVVSILGLDDISSIEGSAGMLRMYFELGVRYLTLTRRDVSALTGAEGRSGGWLKVVHEANRLGVVLHVSDVDRESVLRLQELSSAPLIGSTAAPGRSACLEDDVMRLVKETGGIVMTRAFTSHGEFEPVQQVASELARVAEVVGPQHVGLGTSGDAWSSGRYKGTTVYPELRRELAGRRFEGDDIENMLGGNFIRVWGQIEDAART